MNSLPGRIQHWLRRPAFKLSHLNRPRRRLAASTGLIETLEPRLLLSTIYVAEATDPLEDGSAAHPFDSIQEAIDIAIDGDTVSVGAGEYVEDLLVAVDNLELLGSAGAAATKIKGVVTVEDALFGQLTPNIDIVADGVAVHGFTIESPDVAEGYYSGGVGLAGVGIEIYDNVFVSVQAGDAPDENDGKTNIAIQTYSEDDLPTSDIDGLYIHDNTFQGTPAKGYYGVLIHPTAAGTIDPADPVVIADNTFGGTIYQGIAAQRSHVTISGNTLTTDTTLATGWDNYAIVAQAPDDADQSDVAITQNVVAGSTAGDGFAAGVQLGAGEQDLADVTVTQNALADCTEAVLVSAGAEGVAIHNNDLGDFVDYAVHNEDADNEVVDASGNWFGSNDPDEVAAAVSTYVDYTAWLDVGTDTQAGQVGFQGDFSLLWVDAESPQAGDTSGIQKALELAATDATLSVLPGTYTGDLTIATDGVTLASTQGAGETKIKGVVTDEWANWPLATPNIDIQADGVTIDGFTIESPDVADGYYSSGIVLAGTNAEISDNVFHAIGDGDAGGVAIQTYRDDVLGYEADISGLSIHDNTFTGSPGGGYVGVWVNHTNVGTGLVSIRDNGLSGEIYQGIATERSNVAIRDNQINSTRNAGQGVRILDLDGRDQQDVTLDGNDITGFAVGVQVADAGGQNLTNVDITNNRIVYNDTGLEVRDSADALTVSFNDIWGNTTWGAQNTDAAELDASWNWWGSDTGPTHASNPGGTGDAVSDNVYFLPRTALPARPVVDFDVQLVPLNDRGQILPGEKVKVRFDLVNLGNMDFRDTFTVGLYLSADGVFGFGDFLAATWTGKLKLRAGQATTWTRNFIVDSNWTPGDYRIAVVADPDNAVDELNEGNNHGVTDTVYDINWLFGAQGDEDVKLKLIGPTGWPVLFKISGSGSGTVAPDAQGQWNVTVTDTDAESVVKIQARKGAGSTVNGITVFNELNGIIAPRIDLTGNVYCFGGISRLWLGDVADDHRIDLAAGATYQSVFIELGDVSDTIIDSDLNIRRLWVDSWLAGDDGDDQVLAPAVHDLRCAGDFEAAMGSEAAPLELGLAAIRGSLNNAQWQLTETADAIALGGMSGSDILLNVDISGDLPVFNGPGRIELLDIGEMADSNVAVSELGLVTLANVETDNAGTPFGLTFQFADSILWLRDDGLYEWGVNWPADTEDFFVSGA